MLSLSLRPRLRLLVGGYDGSSLKTADEVYDP
jgi:hypothetical protein